MKSVTFHVLTDQLTLHTFPEFKANGLGAFTTWVPGAGMGHEGSLRLASFRLMYAAMLAEAYTHNDVNRPSMVPSSVMWVSTGAQRVVLVQDADETAGAQMLGLIVHGLKAHLSMCFLGTPTATNYHTPFDSTSVALSAQVFSCANTRQPGLYNNQCVLQPLVRHLSPQHE